MRVLPLINFNRSFVNANKSAHVNRENNFSNKVAHRYTGVASTDLAYASIFDNEIAKDLKLMGLI